MAASWALWRADRARYVTVFVSRLPSGYLFLSEDPGHPGLKRLRRRQRLDEVVDAGGGPLKELERLALWASIQFPMSSPFPHYPPWDANAILWLNQHRVTGAFCAQYAILFGQAAQSYGYAVRYVDLAEEDTMVSHFIASVFVPSSGKWVAFEPAQGFYYMDARRNPLSCLDVHRLWMSRRLDDIRRSTDGKPVGADRAALFERFRIYLRNNFLTLPVRLAQVPRSGGIEYKFEPYRLTWAGEGEGTGDPRFQTQRPEDIEFGFDPSHAVDAVVHTRKGFLRFYAGAEIGPVYRLRIPRGLLARLLDDWIGDPRYLPLMN